jgi:hypothetical protein
MKTRVWGYHDCDEITVLWDVASFNPMSGDVSVESVTSMVIVQGDQEVSACLTLPSHRTYTHTPKPNKPVDPQLATSQQLKVHATHTQKLLV